LLALSFRSPAKKEQLLQDHRKALDAQEIYSKGLKDHLIQFGLRHDKEMKDAQTAAETKLNEALEDANNSNVVLRSELAEVSKARKAAEDRVALIEAEQKDYDLLVMQTNALALRKFSSLFSGFCL
jgi:UDP-N-acetyl-D-mannosaminuronate dehydrogenase